MWEQGKWWKLPCSRTCCAGGGWKRHPNGPITKVRRRKLTWAEQQALTTGPNLTSAWEEAHGTKGGKTRSLHVHRYLFETSSGKSKCKDVWLQVTQAV